MRRRVVVANEILFEEVALRIGRGERVTLRTKGNSMLPFIVGGRDSVELEPIVGELAWGDVVLAHIAEPKRYLIHRVVGLLPEGVRLQGDGNLTPDPIVARNQVIARVERIIRPHSEVKVRTRGALLQARLWVLLLPLRRYLLAILRRTTLRTYLSKTK